MIHVQIASHVTTVGVSGVRWVLLDEAERPEPSVAPAGAPADLPQAIGDYRQAPPHAAGLRDGFALLAWKGLVVLLGLGLAVWAAQTWFGPAPLSWQPAKPPSHAAEAVKPVLETPPPQPVAPAAGDDQAPTPELPASSPGPLITASRA